MAHAEVSPRSQSSGRVKLGRVLKITEKTRMIPTIASAIQPGGEKQAPPHEVQEEQPQQELPPQAAWIA
jgi:hypothetical protein